MLPNIYLSIYVSIFNTYMIFLCQNMQFLRNRLFYTTKNLKNITILILKVKKTKIHVIFTLNFFFSNLID